MIDDIEVLYEDNHIIAINKRVSDIVQGDKTGDKPLAEIVKEYLKEKYQKPGNVFVGVAHRLDRPTSGVVLFAKTSKALARLNKMFSESKIDKTYFAIVKQKPPRINDRLVHYLQRNQKQNKSYASNSDSKDAKKAVLNYKLLASSDTFHLLEIDLETGRHHQIRAQLAAIGCPIKGDLKYGFSRSNKDSSISLHAGRVKFEHPVKKEVITIEAPFPKSDNIWSIFESLLNDKHE
jgi:23S rRNA pseudouridine1911/1915/1917 synthase